MGVHHFVGIDLDGHFNDGIFASSIAQQLSESSYTEVSPSGTGLHIIIKGSLPREANSKNTKEKMEIYSKGRYFTFTGKIAGKDQIIRNQDVINDLVQKYFTKEKNVYNKHNSRQALPVDVIDDQELLDIMFSSQKGQSIERLFNGDTSDYGDDHSSADLALCNYLAFFTHKNAERMDYLFRQSSLYRDKWDRKTGLTTYGQMTIQKAIDQTVAISLFKPQTS